MILCFLGLYVWLYAFILCLFQFDSAYPLDCDPNCAELVSERLASFGLLLRTHRIYGVADRLGMLTEHVQKKDDKIKDSTAILALLLELSGQGLFTPLSHHSR